MKIAEFVFGKKNSGTNNTTLSKPKLDFRQQTQQLIALATRFQVTLIVIAVVGLLSLTALRMLHYADPSVDEARVQENLSKFKQTHINQQAVEKIKQLKDSQATPKPNIENKRTNPFSE